MIAFRRPRHLVLRILASLCVIAVALYALALVYVCSKFSGDAVFPADCAIVFGTAVRTVRTDHGQILYTGPGPGILRRVSTAAELYRAGKIRRVVFSGGVGEGMAESEAEVMRRTAVTQGIAYGDTQVEGLSHSTKENLRFSRPLMDTCGTIVGISDGYHLGRIQLLARQMGWQVMVYPSSTHPTRAFEIKSTLREGMGVLAATFGAPLGLYR